MALPGKENPFAKGLSEKPPLAGMNEKKSFIKIPLSASDPSDTIKKDPLIWAKQTPNSVADFAIAKPTIANYTTAESIIPNKTTSDQTVNHGNIAELAIANSATEEDVSHKATRAEYAAAKDTIAKLADKKSGYTRIDNFVFDLLIPKIGSASASIVYLYLWRRSLGFQKPSVSLSHQIISESVGLSKRAVQEAVLRLNELNVIQTKRAYETAIPEHFIVRFKEAESTELDIAESAIANSAIAENDSSYSRIRHSAIAESATTKINYNTYMEKKSLSLIQVPKPWEQFTAQLTEKARERAERVFQSLIKQFPNDSIDEIAECPKNLERFGAPDGTAWSKINSPIGLMESSWPQLKEFFRQQISEANKTQVARQKIKAQRLEEIAKESFMLEEEQRREKVFLDAFPDEDERKKIIQNYVAGSPFSAEGILGTRIAIEKWMDDISIESAQ